MISGFSGQRTFYPSLTYQFKPRTMEDLKERYYKVVALLAKAAGKPEDCIERTYRCDDCGTNERHSPNLHPQNTAMTKLTRRRGSSSCGNCKAAPWRSFTRRLFCRRKEKPWSRRKRIWVWAADRCGQRPRRTRRSARSGHAGGVKLRAMSYLTLVTGARLAGRRGWWSGSGRHCAGQQCAASARCKG